MQRIDEGERRAWERRKRQGGRRKGSVREVEMGAQMLRNMREEQVKERAGKGHGGSSRRQGEDGSAHRRGHARPQPWRRLQPFRRARLLDRLGEKAEEAEGGDAEHFGVAVDQVDQRIVHHHLRVAE